MTTTAVVESNENEHKDSVRFLEGCAMMTKCVGKWQGREVRHNHTPEFVMDGQEVVVL